MRVEEDEEEAEEEEAEEEESLFIEGVVYSYSWGYFRGAHLLLNTSAEIETRGVWGGGGGGGGGGG